ncbi:sprT domain-containing protein [Flavobacteriaceae bacterium]|nr:sprT domain-containing protein [Flavobacteriaceae bacterium]MDB2418725.1 sprT domain-containing protein [Flavobacteriaceae bacterium]MDB2625300.1 sprT domain-containing protein [Flavobacteriaceae bacterium]MDG1161109.1 sprT domain-containing protein [Flavobacteriaceae bacterium]MDG2444419.1 sprT domain-containing protein [Flavobacteriaceae bacterium]
MINNFHKYIPENAINLVQSLIEYHRINLKIVNQRQTKHGDFRQLANGKFQITINNNLNPFQFLLTLIHEIAHHTTFEKYGRIRPHGKEWKQQFQYLMLPFLNPTIFPDHMLTPLAHYLKNPKASTDSDVKLSLALKGNTAENGKNFVFELPTNCTFIFKNKMYRKGKKRKTRIECIQLTTNRLYLFNQNAEVIVKKL